VRRLVVIGVVLGACGARPPRPAAPPPPVATARPTVPLLAPVCPPAPLVFPATATAIPAPATGADVLTIDTIGVTTTLVTIDRGTDDNVRVGDRGWLVDDDGLPVRGSEFVVSKVHRHQSRGAIRLLRVDDVRRYQRARLLPSD
jgi:hypothetical protein